MLRAVYKAGEKCYDALRSSAILRDTIKRCDTVIEKRYCSQLYLIVSNMDSVVSRDDNCRICPWNKPRFAARKKENRK